MRSTGLNPDPGFSIPATSLGGSYSNPPEMLTKRPEPTLNEGLPWEAFKGTYQQTDPAQAMLHGKHGKRLMIVAALLGLLSKGKALGPFAQGVMGRVEQARGEAKDTAQRDYNQQYNSWKEQMDARNADRAYNLQKYGMDLNQHYRDESADTERLHEQRRQWETTVENQVKAENLARPNSKMLAYDSNGFAKMVESGVGEPPMTAGQEADVLGSVGNIVAALGANPKDLSPTLKSGLGGNLSVAQGIYESFYPGTSESLVPGTAGGAGPAGLGPAVPTTVNIGGQPFTLPSRDPRKGLADAINRQGVEASGARLREGETKAGYYTDPIGPKGETAEQLDRQAAIDKIVQAEKIKKQFETPPKPTEPEIDRGRAQTWAGKASSIWTNAYRATPGNAKAKEAAANKAMRGYLDPLTANANAETLLTLKEKHPGYKTQAERRAEQGYRTTRAKSLAPESRVWEKTYYEAMRQGLDPKTSQGVANKARGLWRTEYDKAIAEGLSETQAVNRATRNITSKGGS